MSETQTPPAASESGCLHPILLAAAGAWIIGATVAVYGPVWVVEQNAVISGQPLAWYIGPLIALAYGVLLAIPVVPLALAVRAPRYQAVYRAWLMALVFVFVLAPVRALPSSSSQLAAVAQIVLGLACSVGLIVAARSRGRRLAFRLEGLAAGVGVGVLAALPAIAFGALGSALDSVLGLLAGLSLGLFAGVLISTLLMAPLAEHSSGRGRDVLLGGLAAGIIFLILGAGFGQGGHIILLALSLPALGFAGAGLAQWAGSDGPRDWGWLPVFALAGLAAAAPLMLIDADEMLIVLGEGEILQWAMGAALLAVPLGWALGGAVIVLGRLNLKPRRPIALGSMALSWAAALLVYFLIGQPGLHGERIFVILRDQADVSEATAIADRAERLAYVYDTLTAHADTTQADMRATLDRLGIDYTPYYLVNALEVDAGPFVRAYLSRQPEVDRILDSPRLRPLPAQPAVGEGELAAPPTSPEWNITSIGADRVWADFGVTGEGIVVGQSDSGADGEHPALRDGYRGREAGDDYNWLDPWNGSAAPTDIGGHGTHTLGSILGRGGIGVAPGAEWFGCVNLARNLANPPLYLTCMQFMLAPYPQEGDALHDGDPSLAAHVINNSWGCPTLEGCDAGSLGPAVRALRAAGVFVVSSAGNSGPGCASVTDPISIYDDVFSVGAIDQGGWVADFSSRGPVTVDGSNRVKPDIVAPGVEVLSSMPGGTYGRNSGTSMAGPHVVGAVALLWSAQPALVGDIDRTEQILIETADAYTGPHDACAGTEIPSDTFGYGVLNVYAAVEAALNQ